MKLPALVAAALALTAWSAFAADPAPAVKVPSPLDSVKQKYVDSSKQVESNLRTFQANGATCGFVGGIIAGKVQGADKATAQSRGQIEKVLSDAGSADAKKKASAKKQIEAQIAVLKDAKAQVDQNMATIKDALSTPTPTCQAAKKAFFASQSGSLSMLQQLEIARQAINGKQANLLTDPIREYSDSSESSVAAFAPVDAPAADEPSYQSASTEL